MSEKELTGYSSIDKTWLKYYTENLKKEPFHGSYYWTRFGYTKVNNM